MSSRLWDSLDKDYKIHLNNICTPEEFEAASLTERALLFKQFLEHYPKQRRKKSAHGDSNDNKDCNSGPVLVMKQNKPKKAKVVAQSSENEISDPCADYKNRDGDNSDESDSDSTMYYVKSKREVKRNTKILGEVIVDLCGNGSDSDSDSDDASDFVYNSDSKAESGANRSNEKANGTAIPSTLVTVSTKPKKRNISDLLGGVENVGDRRSKDHNSGLEVMV